MADLEILDAYHRFIADHNRNEANDVERTREVWGRNATTLSWGKKVQAYPHRHTTATSYSFGCDIPARLSYGFKGNRTVVREVSWSIDMIGVEESQDENYAIIPITWIERAD